jgi:hypothetical protein
MTSRPAVLSQQPAQQRIPARPGAPVRARSAQVTPSVSSARRPGLSVDLSAKGSQSSNGDAQSVAGGSGRASPGTPGLESPNRTASSQRGGKRNGSSNGASSPKVLGNERASIAFPPRPGQYMPEQEIKLHDRPGGLPNWPKPDYKAPSFEAPAAAQIYPQGSMCMLAVFYTYANMTLQRQPISTHGMAIISRTASPSTQSSPASRTNR